MAEDRSSWHQKAARQAAKPLRAIGRGVRDYGEKLVETGYIPGEPILNIPEKPNHVNGERHGNGKEHHGKAQLEQVRAELGAQGDSSSFTVAEMRQKSDELFQLAEQEAAVTNEKRSKSKALKIASAVGWAQDKVSNASFAIRTKGRVIKIGKVQLKIPTEIKVPIGKIAPPIVLGGLVITPLVVSSTAEVITPVTAVVGGLTSGELITKIRESKFIEGRRERRLIKKIEKRFEKNGKDGVTSDTLLPYFKQFSEVVDPADVRDCLRTRHGKGALNEIANLVYKKTKIEPDEGISGKDDLDEWEDLQQEHVVHIVMEAQQKAQEARSRRTARYGDAIDQTRDLGIGLGVVGSISLLAPATGLVDDIVNVANASVTLATSIAGERIKQKDKKPQIHGLTSHIDMEDIHQEVGRVSSEIFKRSDAFRKQARPKNVIRQTNQIRRR